MSAYADADVRVALAAFQAACATSPTAYVDSQRAMKHALDAVAPAIAARALREAAKRYASFERPDSGLIPPEWADGFMEALDGASEDLRDRADEIERGTP